MLKLKIYAGKKFDNKEFMVVCKWYHVQDGIFYFFKEDSSTAFFTIPAIDTIIFVLETIVDM